MSASAGRGGGGRPLDVPPAFELEAAYDDPENPGTVTVHPADPEDPTTEWLTIDVGFAVPIEETV